MQKALAIIGAVLLTLAGVSAVFAQSTVTITASVSATASCTSAGTCSATATITNVDETNTPLTVWFVLRGAGNGAGNGEIVGLPISQVANVQPGSTGTLTQSYNLSPGTYQLTVFSVNSLGYPESVQTPAVVTFSTGTYLLEIYSGGGSLTVSPQGTACGTPCGNPIGAAYTYPVGSNTAVSIGLTPQSGLFFKCWSEDINLGDQSCTTTSNPVTVTMSASHTLQAIFTQVPTNGIGIQPAAQTGATISPLTPTYVYPPGLGSQYPSSVTFNLGHQAGYALTGWKLSGTNLSGNASSLTLTYSQLTGGGASAGSSYQLVAKASMTFPVIVQQGINPSQITVEPAYGTYYVAPGGSFTVTASGLGSGYCFLGWIDSGTLESSGYSYTVSNVQAPHALAPDVVAAVGGSCSNVPPPPPKSSGNSLLTWALGVPGVLLLGLGIVWPSGRRFGV